MGRRRGHVHWLTYLCGLKDFGKLHIRFNLYSDLCYQKGWVSVRRDAVKDVQEVGRTTHAGSHMRY